ncbi:helix-turn-helix domain-containing protein [Nocardioides sp. WV_118_6]|uniref:helix-turn-helix domain-containing protein n=1 Tax=Nocardioides simplex TaxID=2045 RepID=UPI00214FE397|nr:helix-turn-helix domain-containing protein [Pimelobacter simplex]UUW91472.1 helix-turn-helix domain-containing protein [Pimelobacter simplex]UUW95300.1 helix-turn-helix domain-containing protein [Pimelobacter simplex]
MTSANGDADTPSADLLGSRVRAARTARGMSLRDLARRVGVSPSFVSQLENNKVNASVGTLYKLVNALEVSLDDLMSPLPDPSPDPGPARVDRAPRTSVADLDALPPMAWDPEEPVWPRVQRNVQRGTSRAQIRFPGVTWERLTREADPFVDFLHVTYDEGSASCPEDDMMRHGGREYGFVLEGRLDVQVGFETHTLEPGDSITFDAMTPHRLSNPHESVCRAIWFVVARRNDERSAALDEPSPQVTHLPALQD